MLHVPVLRGGTPYRSLSVETLRHLGTGEPVAELSLANPGLIARDLESSSPRDALDALSTRELLAVCGRAAEAFVGETLPVGDQPQSPDDYVRQLSATTGLPRSLARANMEKVRYVLAEMETVLNGLTRGLDLEVLDRGWGSQGGCRVSFRREAERLGAVLPSNSPGVHSLWIPAVALKVGLALKPGRQEPWTPYRIAQALMAAGCPPAAAGLYPTDHSGAAEILLRTERSLLFGDRDTVAPWSSDPRVEIHGPGWSKVVLGPDAAEGWPDHVEVIAESVAANGGRSCVNASGVWTPAYGREVAEGLAERLAAVPALGLEDPEARLAAFPSREAARAMSDHLDRALADGGAEDVTARYRAGGRVAEVEGCAFLLPTVVRCDSPDHPLARSEFLFPFVSVVQVPAEDLVSSLGPTLVASVVTKDDELVDRLLRAPHVDRLNVGPIPTCTVSWDQPHEGNLFEHLYHRRAFQAAS